MKFLQHGVGNYAHEICCLLRGWLEEGTDKVRSRLLLAMTFGGAFGPATNDSRKFLQFRSISSIGLQNGWVKSAAA